MCMCFWFRPPIYVPLAAGVEFIGSLIICAMYSGNTFCISIDAYELATKFVLGCFFTCLGIATTHSFIHSFICDVIAELSEA